MKKKKYTLLISGIDMMREMYKIFIKNKGSIAIRLLTEGQNRSKIIEVGYFIAMRAK